VSGSPAVPDPASPGAPVAALIAFLLYLALERVAELALSRAHTRRLLARGAVESAPGHYPLLVVLHLLWPLALIAELLWGGARPGRAAWAWLALFGVAQLLRASSIAALGERWTVRVLAVPGEPPVRSGIYRWLRHPNYLAVVIELAAAPLMFGAWRTALGATLANLVALAIRIPAEERALGMRNPRA
jgi:methyltransferase